MSRRKLELRSNAKLTSDQSNNLMTGLYDFEHTIGQGHFAIVKSARHIFSGERVAIKIIDKLKLDSISRDHLFQEVKCMKLVQHPNVVRLYEVIDTANKLYLIQEFGDGGDMYDYIMKHSDGLDEDQAKIYFRQIVNAIKYCHDLKVVHRDLKPENVVFFQQTGQVKLTDFGFSNIYEPGSKLLTSCGSLAYSAPEILLGDSYHAPPVDIWSLGVILYMLVTGRAPFQEASDSETLTMILDCKYYLPDYLSTECTDLISRMIVRDPIKRMSLDEIKRHDWLARLDVENEDSDNEIDIQKGLTEADREKIIKLMVDGEICESKETIEENVKLDQYNYITATFYLLAEKMTKSKIKKRKNFVNLPSKRKVLVDLQPIIQNKTSSSVLSKNQFKMQQRNLLMRQSEAKEEDEGLVEEENEMAEEDENDENDKEVENFNLSNHNNHIDLIKSSPTVQLTNIIEDEDEKFDEINKNIKSQVQINLSTSRRSSRGTVLGQSENLISKLTIPEEECGSEKDLSPEMVKNIQDESIFKLRTPLTLEETSADHIKLRPPKMSTDTSDSETEQNKNHEWTRSTSSSSRSRARIRSNTNFQRPLSLSSDNEHQIQHQSGQAPFSQKTLSVEHRLANMSQMSISSQLSKNNSFRFHRSTITGTETPIQLYNQQISSTTPTPRESIVFSRGDDKPIAKILQQMNSKSKSVESKVNESESKHQVSVQVRNNNDSYSRAIKQSTIPVVNDEDDHKMEVPENKLLENVKILNSMEKDINFVGINDLSNKKQKKSFCSKCCSIV
ncbi:unnamed protein product [Brachionus calyciflorus]|uniref:SNF-related serine/threonine-protein kinase n=1 Tax=Brachionus calyciflorus TaxID=104777 RepID=A0A813NAZ4_9BILA|nr:unnamed protein product [Brachionus calyciflorus]